MASVNPLSRELVFKVVYCGPGLCGKTTTLQYLHATIKPEHRGRLVSLATPVDRTLYFDFLPIRVPPIRGMSIRLQLFTVPGQVYFNATRKLVLTGADGLVFVSDSQMARADANLESLENLRENLSEQGRDLSQLPLVFQHNKRDLSDLVAIEELDATLNRFGAPSVASSARTGIGIYEALEAISARVLLAFSADMPEADAQEMSFAPAEGGLAEAIREASPGENGPASRAVVTRIPTPAHKWPTMPPNATLEDSTKKPVLPVEPPSLPRASELPVTRPEGRASDGVSFASLWPDVDREAALAVEDAIAGQRFAEAIELCDGLVSRALTGAAGLSGVGDAPCDPGLLALLLGLDGRRYLAFKAAVSDARVSASLEAHDALAAYAFAVDARLARAAVREPRPV
jgi:signal recognition particle receptor subunit beta